MIYHTTASSTTTTTTASPLLLQATIRNISMENKENVNPNWLTPFSTPRRKPVAIATRMSKAIKLTQREAERLVNRLKNTNEEKFKTMCKMHLSFLLDLPGDSLEEFLGEGNNNNETKNKKSMPHFPWKRNHKESCGVHLTSEGVASAYKLIEYLAKPENIKQEGLFRKTGNVARQKELKDKLVNGQQMQFDGTYSAHDCASVLKKYLGDLTEPLLTEKLYIAFCQIPDMMNDTMDAESAKLILDKQIKTFRLLFLLLPRQNAVLLECLLHMLQKVTDVKENKMTSDTLGTMFAPHILVPRKMGASELHAVASNITRTVAFMIEYAADVSMVPLDLAQDIDNYWKQMEEKTHSLDDCLEKQANKFLKKSESSGSDAPLNTCVTFVDRPGSKQATAATDTEVALAQLYAHVQNMPESAKKRKLLKQFNKANSLGTPHNTKDANSAKKKHSRSSSLGNSIKKHFLRHKRSGSGHDIALAELSVFSANSTLNHSVQSSNSVLSNLTNTVSTSQQSTPIRQKLPPNALQVLPIVKSPAMKSPVQKLFKEENEIKNRKQVIIRSEQMPPIGARQRHPSKPIPPSRLTKPAPPPYPGRPPRASRSASATTVRARAPRKLNRYHSADDARKPPAAESPPVLVVDMGRSSSRPPSYRKRKNNQYGSHRSLCNEVIAESTENSTECPNLQPDATSSSPACKRALAKTPEHLRNKPTAFVSPISRSVKKASRCIQHNMMTPGSRTPMAMIQSPEYC